MNIIDYIKSKIWKDTSNESNTSPITKSNYHDYIHQYWGNSLDLSKFKGTDRTGKAFQSSFRCSGFGPILSGRLLDNDILIVKMASGYIGAFQVWNVSYCRDPRDLWFAEAKWLGYPRPEGSKPLTEVEYYNYKRRTI